MKNRLIYLASILAFLCSCIDEPFVNDDRSLRITGYLATDSRTTFLQEGNVTQTHWAKGDKIGIYTDKQTNLPYQAMSDGATTEFSKSGQSLERTDGAKVRAYYPYDSESKSTVTLPTTLSLYSNKPAPVFLYSEATVTGSEVSLQFKHYFAYLRITLSAELFRTLKSSHNSSNSLTYEGSGIYITSTEPISCVSPCKLNLETMDMTNGADCLRTIYRCPDVDIEGDDIYTFLIPVLPQSPSAEIKISLFYKKKVEDGKLYPVLIEKKTPPQDGIQAGHVYEVNYTNTKQVTNLMDDSQTTLNDIFARNKLTQVITLEADAVKMARLFNAARVNHHLDYQSKGMETIVFTGAKKGQDNDHLKDSIQTLYADVAGISWLYGNHNGPTGHSYFYDAEGQLVYTAAFSTSSGNAGVQTELDAFLRTTLGAPAEHPEFKMNFYTSTDYSMDGEVYLIQQATEGKGVDIILMGDGFTDKHMNLGGRYEAKMQEAIDKIFSIEPIKGLRNRFNIYGVKVVSPNAEFTNDAVHAINKENSVALSYAALTGTDCPLVAVIYNTDEYVERSYSTIYWDSSCVAYCMDKVDGTLIHELCGHGIAWVADEYVETENEKLSLPESKREDLDNRYWPQRWGWYGNVDYHATASTVRWAHFLSDERYKAENLGIYEGAYYYAFGVYRSSENSIMRSSDLNYFNAPSREMIYKAVMMRSEGDEWLNSYNYEDFVTFDEAARNEYANSRSVSVPTTDEELRRVNARHLPPTIIKGNWQDDLKKGSIRIPLR